MVRGFGKKGSGVGEGLKPVGYAVGFDFGTSGLKAVLVDESGRTLARVVRPYATQRPHAGWSEQDPEDWWQALREVAAILAADHPPPDVVGLSGHMHAPVLLDAGGGVLAPAILWNDQRSTVECDDIDRLTAGRIADWTGNPTRTAFTASKLLWLRRHRPDIHARIDSVLLPKDFIRFRLTGVAATDASDASGTSLFDVGAGCWSEQTFDALDIPVRWLPAVAGSAVASGRITDAAAEQTGLPAGIPVVTGASDQSAAALGCGIVAPGTLSINLGTSATVTAVVQAPSADPTGACHTFRHAVPNTWQIMGGVLSAGGAVQWYRDRIAANGAASEAESADGYDEILAGAHAAPPGADGLIFLPYLTGERAPHNDPQARGGWIGLTARHDRRHLSRALLEGVCFALRQIVERVEAVTGTAGEVRIAGGGARGGGWPVILASILGRPLRPVATVDASAYGAAMLGMAGLSDRHPAALAADWVGIGAAIEPAREDRRRYDDMYEIYASLYPAMRAAMHGLSAVDRENPGSNRP